MFAKVLYREGVCDEKLFWKPWLNFVQIDSIGRVFEALEALDGKELNTMVVAERPGAPEDDLFWSGNAMIVSGGEGGMYYCRAYFENEPRAPYWVGVKPGRKRTHETVSVRIGQLQHVWRYRIIAIEDARKALDVFVRSGEMNDALEWEPEIERRS